MKRLTYVIGFVIVAFGVTKIVIGLSHASKQSETNAAEYVAIVIHDSVPSADSVIIHYDVRGEGNPALVFVHGWSANRSYWREQAGEFAENYRVVTIDLAGHGESGLNRQDWTMEAFGADVAAVVNRLELERVILIGHSMGGMVVIEAARLLHDNVIGIVGVDSYTGIGQTYPDSAIDAYLAPFKEDFKTASYDLVLTMFPEISDSSLMREIAEDISSAPPEVAFGSYEAVVKYLYTDPVQMLTWIKELDLPIRGINCDFFPPDVEAVRAAARSFDAKTMTGVGHFLQMEDPETFNRLLHETIAEIISESEKRQIER